MNRRIRPSRPKTAQDLARQDRPQRIRQLQRHSQDLSQEIQRLECTIAAAPHAIRQRRLASLNTLPALTGPARKPLAARTRRIPLHQQRTMKRQRLGLILELAMVVLALAAAVGWMKQWLHFGG